MLDIDGTIYQTLDAKERAWHGGTANSRSVGIEIANMGAYASGEAEPFKQWYGKDEKGRTRITIPQRLGDGGVRTPNFVGYPIRDELIVGEVQGRQRRQYDLTREQYDSLIKLTATLCKVLPNIECDYPRDEDGKLITKALTEEQQKDYRGLIGHYHVTTQKSDPGPAFQWDYVVDNARKLMGAPRKTATGRVKTAPPTTQPATAPNELAGR
jgi:N-acetyl-anhydromuramyl-L-alanine amidase AmpD